MKQVKTYDNGLRLVVETNSGLRSVTAGILVNVGSSKEDKSINGLSHFTEHMMFKGTKTKSAYEISNEFEKLGCIINAYTSKECTCYYYKTIDENSKAGFELLSEIFFESVFDEGELDKERKVIIEEINMIEDAPDDICSDLVSLAGYGDKGIGQGIIGTIDNVKKFSSQDVKDFVAKYYTAKNIVVSFAGNITLEEADKLVQKYVIKNVKKTEQLYEYPVAECQGGNYLERIKDFEQSNIAIGFKAYPIKDKRLMALKVLSIVIGGGMSSRLFQSIREEQGLAYSCYSIASANKNNGSLYFLLNISVENTEKALKSTATEIKKLIDSGITKEEMLRAKTQLKTGLIFSEERPDVLMSGNARSLAVTDEVIGVDEVLKECDAVSLEDIKKVIAEVLDEKNMFMAYVGKKHDVDFTKALKLK